MAKVNFKTVKGYIDSLDPKRNSKQIQKLLLSIISVAKVCDVEERAYDVARRIWEGDKTTLKDLLRYGYNNITLTDLKGNRYDECEDGFTLKQLSMTVEVTKVYLDSDCYTSLMVKEIKEA